MITNRFKDVPQNWIQLKVDDLAALYRGISYKKHEVRLSSAKGFMPILRANNINGKLNFKDLVYVPSDKIKKEQNIKKGDLIFAMSSGSKHLVGKCAPAINDFNGSYGAFCALLRPIDLINKSFFSFYFQGSSYRKFISEIAKGTNINNLKREHLLDIEFPLPPLPEQHRIVAKIEELFSELDHGVENLKKAQAQLKTYRQAVLKYAFEGKLTEEWRTRQRRLGKPPEPAEKLLEKIKAEREKYYQGKLKEWEKACKQAKAEGKKKPAKPRKPKELSPLTDTELKELPELPDGWCWVNINEVSIFVTDGDHNPPKRIESGIPHLTAKHIQNNKVSFNGCTFISDKDFQKVKKRYEPKESDLIVTCVGTIGRTAVVQKGFTFSADRNLAIIRFPDIGIMPEFVEYFLNTAFAQNKIKSSSGSTAQPHFYLGDIRKFQVPLSDIEEQNDIIEEIESRLSICDKIEQTIEESLNQAEALCQSILKKAFEGKLVPQDPNDEPAEKLLERIRAEKEKFEAEMKSKKKKVKKRKKKTA